MKKFSDYKGEDAIELWADLLEPIAMIMADKDVADLMRSNKPVLVIAPAILKAHKREAEQILLRIDDTPLDGLNILVRFLDVFGEITADETVMSFFSSQGQNATGTSSGSATESTEAAES